MEAEKGFYYFKISRQWTGTSCHLAAKGSKYDYYGVNKGN